MNYSAVIAGRFPTNDTARYDFVAVPMVIFLYNFEIRKIASDAVTSIEQTSALHVSTFHPRAGEAPQLSCAIHRFISR